MKQFLVSDLPLLLLMLFLSSSNSILLHSSIFFVPLQPLRYDPFATKVGIPLSNPINPVDPLRQTSASAFANNSSVSFLRR